MIEMDKIKDHLANERTFLAWIRTGIGIMAFGFVVEKFSLFLAKIETLIIKSPLASEHNMDIHLRKYSAVFGIILVLIGAVMNILAYVKYKQIRKQIIINDFKSTFLLDFILTMIVFLIGLILSIYLTTNIFVDY